MIHTFELNRKKAEGVDPDEDELIFSLDSSPGEMIITETGLIHWTPTQTQVGVHHVIVRVEDPEGLSDIQNFDIEVLSLNLPPEIISQPLTEFKLNQRESNPEIMTFSNWQKIQFTGSQGSVTFQNYVKNSLFNLLK